MQIVLYQTDMAQNVGSIARTCVAMGVTLHLIEPLGFVWNEPKMRRAGMDYLDRLNLVRHKSWEDFLAAERPQASRLVLLTTKGAKRLETFPPQENDYFIFGRESCGVPPHVETTVSERVFIPMIQGERSLNLAQSCAMVMFYALVQTEKLPQ